MEIWKDIKGYEGLYRVSNKGNVYTYYRNRLLKPTVSISRRAVFVGLMKDGIRDAKPLSRVVYDHFFYKTKRKLDFKDGDFTNCSAENLIEVKYTMVFKDKSCVRVLNTETQKMYNSISELAKYLGVSNQSVSKGLKNPKSNKYAKYKLFLK